MIHILVVDGELQLRQHLRMILEEAGYELFEAQDGDQALKADRNLRANLLITDELMPSKERIGTDSRFPSASALHESDRGLWLGSREPSPECVSAGPRCRCC